MSLNMGLQVSFGVWTPDRTIWVLFTKKVDKTFGNMARFSMYSGEQIHAQIDVDFDTRVGVVRPLATEAAVLLREARESN